ncbi:MAG: LytR C-terminal domain-containing protein [Candidatus Eisenbacteria bacterium]
MAKRKKRRRRKKKSSRASVGYTIAAIVLFAVVLYFGASLLSVFSPPPSRSEELTVLVLNGCGVEGIGQRTASRLRELGLDVVDFRNADSFDYPESIVIDRTGDMASAASVARLIGTANVIQQIPETPLVDIIIVVGADYASYLGG